MQSAPPQAFPNDLGSNPASADVGAQEPGNSVPPGCWPHYLVSLMPEQVSPAHIHCCLTLGVLWRPFLPLWPPTLAAAAPQGAHVCFGKVPSQQSGNSGACLLSPLISCT